jgi:hypothetical protein
MHLGSAVFCHAGIGRGVVIGAPRIATQGVFGAEESEGMQVCSSAPASRIIAAFDSYTALATC